MPQTKTDLAGGLALMDELVRLTAPPASEREIAEQGLALTARTLKASGAVLFLRPGAGATDPVVWGRADPKDLAPAAERAMRTSDVVEENSRGAMRAAIPLPGATGPVGAIALAEAAAWGPVGRLFAASAARTIASALQAARMLVESRRQGELLAQRNVELEILRELAGRIQECGDDEAILQAALDLVLDKLGLAAGWIFWGQSVGRRLELAASRGVTEAFVCQARESGIGECLCQDVFATGKLRMARNTIDCPRLPDLVVAGEPMTHACVPLKFERGTQGVMNIANRPGRLFTEQELRFLETVGRQVCLAVDKARTARAESRRDAEARALASLTRAIGGSLDQGKVLAAVGEYGRKLLATDRCTILLGDGAASQRLAYLSGPPLEGLVVGAVVDLEALGSRAFLAALAERRTLVVRDVQEDPRVNADLARRWGIRSAVIVPLLAHDRLEGLLAADRSRPSNWGSDEVELATALAGQAALAIENARLYREAQEMFLGLQRAQDGMLRAERMAAVGTLASSLAHEVRNPLNSIGLQLVLLSRRLNRLEGSTREELAALVESARAEIGRLDGLVEEFLSLSTIDRLALTETDPRSVLREVSALMTPIARQKKIAVVEDLADGLPPLRLDPEKMKQVLLNLVRNGIEAMPQGGTLTLETRASEDAVVIRIADTGVGIESGLDIFDFFTTTKRGGTGLGLPIARRIVEAHGGTLTFESAPGRGATFSIMLGRLGGGR
jgi:signal transduction histidine kinase